MSRTTNARIAGIASFVFERTLAVWFIARGVAAPARLRAA
jgi:hypothetical protein